MQDITKSILKINKSNQQEIILQICRQTTLKELYDFLFEQKYLEQNQIWLCYSTTTIQFLTEQNQTPWINKFQDDLLFIPTQQQNQIVIPQKNIQQNPNTALSKEQNQSKMEEEVDSNEKQGQLLRIIINIRDGIIVRLFRLLINENEIVDQIAQQALRYLGLQSEVASIDLYSGDFHYNSYNRRMRTLKELQLRDDFTFEAKVRWIGA